MKTRLVIFILGLLLLPVAGLWLSGAGWGDLVLRGLTGDAAIINPPSTLLTTLMMAGYIIFINHLNQLISGNRPFQGQSSYLLRVAAASAVLGWLLAYLNLYVASWTTQIGNPLLQALLYTPLFAALAPAVLCTRAFIAALPGVLQRLHSHRTFAPPAPEKLAYALLLLAALGLAGGAGWRAQLHPLLWLAPLLLLTALQLLWHENTIFSGLKSGDYGRMICSGVAGLITGNFVLFAYQSNGGLLVIQDTQFKPLGLLLFGLLCIQLADMLAEEWRGKKRGGIFPTKKPLIPVVVKNNGYNHLPGEHGGGL
jgi:hypothetical protein